MTQPPPSVASGSAISATTPSTDAKPPRMWRTFVTFLIPMMVSNILQALSGTFNNIYLGQMLGVQALAAVSAFFPVVFFFIAFSIGLGAGASVLIGQAWGAKEPLRVKAIAGTTLSVGLIGGAIVAVFGGSFTHLFMAGLGTPADILPSTTAYARVMFWAMPGLFLFLLSTSMLRGVGDSVTPLWTLCISTAVGLLVTPALIRGWWGLPQLGVTSGAWGAVVSYVVAMVWLAFYLLWRKHPLAPDRTFLRSMRIQPALLAKVLRIGLPTGLQMVVIALSEVAVLFLVNRFGSEATAAYGAVNQVVAYVQFPALSIAITASILGAQAIGAGRGDTLGKIARTGIHLNLALTGTLVLLAYLFSRHILALFITSPPVIELAQTLLHIMLWSTIIFGMQAVLSGLMRASGSVLVPTGISIFCILGVEVPVAWVLSRHMGLNGIWIAYPITFICMLALQTAYYRLVWKKKPLRRL